METVRTEISRTGEKKARVLAQQTTTTNEIFVKHLGDYVHNVRLRNLRNRGIRGLRRIAETRGGGNLVDETVQALLERVPSQSLILLARLIFHLLLDQAHLMGRDVNTWKKRGQGL